MSKWQLTLNEQQAQVIVKALDLYSRIGMGQLKELLQHPDIAKRLLEKGCSPWKEAEGLLTDLKFLIFDLYPSSFHGILSGDIQESNREAWDIQQVLRNGIAWDKYPEGGIGVNWDIPFKSSEQPLPTFKKIEDPYNA